MRKFIISILFLITSASIAAAQCVNTIKPSCSVYTKCFSKYCNCSNSNTEYLLSFGEKYCVAFLDQANFSEVGKKWRDSALRCLQEKLVTYIPLELGKQCNCQKLRQFALGTHVSCYVDVSPSVCDLPLGDIAQIGRTIIINKAFLGVLKELQEGKKQVRDAIERCSRTAIDEARRRKWAFQLRLLDTALGTNRQ